MSNIWEVLFSSGSAIEGTVLKNGMSSRLKQFLCKINTSSKATISYPITRAIEQLINGNVNIAITEKGYHIECEDQQKSLILEYRKNSDLKVFASSKGKNSKFCFCNDKFVHWSIFLPRIIEILDLNSNNYDTDFSNDFNTLLEKYKGEDIKRDKEIFRLNDYIYCSRFEYLQRATDILIENSNECSRISKDLTPIILQRKGTFEYATSDNETIQIGNKDSFAIENKFILDNNIKDDDKLFIPKLDLANIKVSRKVYNLTKMIKEEFNSANKVNNLLFYGPSGSGKSTAAKIIAQLLGLPYRFLNLSLNTDEYHLTGEFVPTGKNEFSLTETSFVKAFRDGGIIELVELNYARPGVLGVLNSALDDTQRIALPNGKIIKRNPSCIIIATTNVGYAGCQQTNLSFIDRFHKIINFNKLTDKDLLDIIVKNSGNNDESLINKMIAVSNKIGDFVKQNEIESDICFTRQLCNWARDVKYSENPLISAKDTILPGISLDNEIQEEIYEQILKTMF